MALRLKKQGLVSKLETSKISAAFSLFFLGLHFSRGDRFLFRPFETKPGVQIKLSTIEQAALLIIRNKYFKDRFLRSREKDPVIKSDGSSDSSIIAAVVEFPTLLLILSVSILGGEDEKGQPPLINTINLEKSIKTYSDYQTQRNPHSSFSSRYQGYWQEYR